MLSVLKNADPAGEKLTAYILSQEAQEILAKYGFRTPSTSVPEHQGVSGILSNRIKASVVRMG
ncbi:hypothetical protein [Nostoc sp. CALU 546]|uniref:hypothetical protein n=1 Tax=Nostoc sp. CALU 546 TaxID=1867241 RepID=UPI003B66C469